MEQKVVISGSGLFTPEHSISNEELVDSYNRYAAQINQQNAEAIEAGTVVALPYSSADFIHKASGIRSRYIYQKEGALDIDRMRPKITPRADDELSHQAEMGLAAARDALANANKSANDIDCIIVSCAYTQRAYPAIAIEIQHALGVHGFAFDMLVACSAATFGVHRAFEMVKAGTANSVLVINPELVSPQVNYKDRDSHFIFGDVATAMVIERAETASSAHVHKILSTKAVTQYSNNIRSNFSYLNHATDLAPFAADMLFHQEGRKVFKEVCPMAAAHIESHLGAHQLVPNDVKKWFLHQANINMNTLIIKKLLGREADKDEAPIVLDTYANTASAGSIIAFHLHQSSLLSQEYSLLCSFGAGYSIGSLVLQKE